MGAVLEPLSFDLTQFRAELAALGALLASKPHLSERDDILPLFASSRHLSAGLGMFDPWIHQATELACEFPFFGDYRADLVLGRKASGHFCVVEFEEGGPDSVFKKQPRRGNPEWSARFEHGFSQLADWFFHLDDYKKTHGFAKAFGAGHVTFSGLLIVGRTAGLDDMKRTRLRWRSNKVRIDSNAVTCLTFDEVAASLRERYAIYNDVSPETVIGGAASDVPNG